MFGYGGTAWRIDPIALLFTTQANGHASGTFGSFTDANATRSVTFGGDTKANGGHSSAFSVYKSVCS